MRFLHGCWLARLRDPLRGGERRSRQAQASALASAGRVIGLRSNLNGKGDVYWIFYRNEEGEKDSDGPPLPEEIERVP